MSWQQHDKYHLLSFVMFVSGAKLEEHCFNISRDILDWVLYCFRGTTYDVIAFLICITQKRKYQSVTKKDIPKKTRHFSLLLRAFQISSNYFLLHRHFKTWVFLLIAWRARIFFYPLESRVQLSIYSTTCPTQNST